MANSNISNTLNARRAISIVLLVPFSILSVYAIYKVGYAGIFDYQRHSLVGVVFWGMTLIAVNTARLT